MHIPVYQTGTLSQPQCRTNPHGDFTGGIHIPYRRWCELSPEFGSGEICSGGTKFSVKILFNTPTVVMRLS